LAQGVSWTEIEVVIQIDYNSQLVCYRQC
jgi:hypothetical protein